LAKRIEEDSAAYQGLVRKNLELRQQLQDMEKKYADLENERNVLILHVKDLQATRDATDQVIQDLKGKIAALRIEMLKDPKMVQTLDSLNQKAIEATQQKEDLQKKVDVLESEKETILNELNVIRGLYEKEKEISGKGDQISAQAVEKSKESEKRLSQELLQARAQFEQDEMRLKEKLQAAEEQAKGLEQKNAALQDGLKAAQAEREDLEGKNEMLRKDLEAAQASLEKAEADLRKTPSVSDKDKEKIAAEFRKSEEKLIEELAFAQAKSKMLDEEIRKLKQDLNAAEVEKKDFEQKSITLREELYKAEAALKEAEKTVAQRAAQEFSEKKEGRIAALEKEDFAAERAALKRTEGELRDKIRTIERENESLAGKLDETKTLWEETQKDLEARLARANEENDRLYQDAQQKEREGLEGRKDLSGRLARLEADLQEAQADQEKAGKELSQAQARIAEIEDENRKLAEVNTQMDALVKKSIKDLEDQAREAKYDQEHIARKAKDAAVDKLMLEAKMQALEERARSAEAKLAGMTNDMTTKTAQVSLQESEIMNLREEKAKLEQKLLKYVEKILEAQRPGLKDLKPEKRGESSDEEWGGIDEAPKVRAKRELDEQKLDMHYNLAIAYDRRRMYKEARQEYLKCLAINPNDANVHYNLAILYDDKLNMNAKAIEHYQKYLELRPIGEDAEKVKTWMLHAEQEDRLGRDTR